MPEKLEGQSVLMVAKKLPNVINDIEIDNLATEVSIMQNYFKVCSVFKVLKEDNVDTLISCYFIPGLIIQFAKNRQ